MERLGRTEGREGGCTTVVTDSGVDRKQIIRRPTSVDGDVVNYLFCFVVGVGAPLGVSDRENSQKRETYHCFWFPTVPLDPLFSAHYTTVHSMGNVMRIFHWVSGFLKDREVHIDRCEVCTGTRLGSGLSGKVRSRSNEAEEDINYTRE